MDGKVEVSYKVVSAGSDKPYCERGEPVSSPRLHVVAGGYDTTRDVGIFREVGERPELAYIENVAVELLNPPSVGRLLHVGRENVCPVVRRLAAFRLEAERGRFAPVAGFVVP